MLPAPFASPLSLGNATFACGGLWEPPGPRQGDEGTPSPSAVMQKTYAKSER